MKIQIKTAIIVTIANYVTPAALAYTIEAIPPDLLEEKRSYSPSSKYDPLTGILAAGLKDVIADARVIVPNTSKQKKICLESGNISGYYSLTYSFNTEDNSGDAIIALKVKNREEIIGKKVGLLYLKVRQIEVSQECNSSEGLLLSARWGASRTNSIFLAVNGGEEISTMLSINGGLTQQCQPSSDIGKEFVGKKFNFLCEINRASACGRNSIEIKIKSGTYARGTYMGTLDVDCL